MNTHSHTHTILVGLLILGRIPGELQANLLSICSLVLNLPLPSMTVQTPEHPHLPDLIPSYHSCILTTSNQVFLGIPLGLALSTYIYMHFPQSSLSFLSKWPIHLNLFLFRIRTLLPIALWHMPILFLSYALFVFSLKVVPWLIHSERQCHNRKW